MGDERAELLKRLPRPKPREPLWKGPESSGPNGGITFSLLSRFIQCRERFRVHTVEGLRPVPQFSHRIEYGSMWHVCEEYHAKGEDWDSALYAYCEGLSAKYPLAREQIRHWREVCRVQFPHYVTYWKDSPDEKGKTALLQEQVFDVPYKLPSGRTVRLRGKWDGVDLIREGKGEGVYLFETKTKGDIDPLAIPRQLTFDLQTMLYMVALLYVRGEPGSSKHEFWKDRSDLVHHPLRGVRYNVVRRPLSGGKGSIVRHKPTKSNPAGETERDFYDRLSGVIAEDPASFFMRWKTEIAPSDIKKFRQTCLDPLLENVCQWYESQVTHTRDRKPIPPHCLHWRHPFGVRNTLDEGGSTDLDHYLETGSEVGLTRADTLFQELES